MRVKILSMHRVINYGSFMQAYALKKIIESFGHSPEFCDFEPGKPRHLGSKVKSVTKYEKLLMLPKYVISPMSLIRKRQFSKEKYSCFTDDAWPELGITKNKNLDYSGQVLVIGSDEVFNYTQNQAFGYVPALFGHGVTASSIIAYAASAGYTNVDDIEADNMSKEISSGLKKFSSIGVRDKNTFEIVTRYSDHIPKMVVDPTLLYDFSSEILDNVGVRQRGKYLLIYAYQGRLDSSDEIHALMDCARSNNLRLVSVGFYHDWCDDNLVVHPFELLSLFKNSEAVITDTFHGTIFAIINNKKFISLLRYKDRKGSNSNKLSFLLSQLGLEKRISRTLFKLCKQLEEPINYHSVYTRLDELRDTSYQFLDDALSSASMHSSELKKFV